VVGGVINTSRQVGAALLPAVAEAASRAGRTTCILCDRIACSPPQRPLPGRPWWPGAAVETRVRDLSESEPAAGGATYGHRRAVPALGGDSPGACQRRAGVLLAGTVSTPQRLSSTNRNILINLGDDGLRRRL
jgi:hypothetical protein